VRVRPDVPGLDKCFDYLVPPELAGEVRVGSVVRISLHNRRVGGWVVADDVDPPAGVELRPLAKVTGWGPPPELVDLADWAAWRWAGRPVAALRTASPDVAVRGLPRSPARPAAPAVTVATGDLDALAAEALGESVAVLRLPPAADPYALLVAAAARGPALVIGPSASAMRHLGLRLRRAGLPVAVMPRDWAVARAGGATVLGARAAAWAPLAEPAAVIVLDEHDEGLQQEQAPTWHARDVAVERARRAGVPCVLVSPVPSLEALALGRLLTPSRQAERAGWPRVDVVDTRELPPNQARYSQRLVDVLRSDADVLCVLNRKGRSRLLSCAACGEVAACERCQASVTQRDDGALQCARCGEVRPQVCIRCGGTRMKNLRAGVSRAREELEALARRPVVELTADATLGAGGPGAGVVVGTEAALHQLDAVDVVAFLDLDQELLAPRYRAAEEALSLVARAARLVGGREGTGRLLLQTRLPDHEVVRAALLADPARVASAELARRRVLGYPPITALALVSGTAAAAFVDGLGTPEHIEVMGPDDGRWLVRAPDHATLADALARVPRPPGRLRIEVDPLRL
jgi:primosomal protein N' (replication factor Y)